MNKLLLTLILLVFYLGSSSAQTNGYFATQKTYKNGLVAYYNKKAKKQSQKINEYLQLTTIHHLLNNQNDTLSSLNWKIKEHINNKRILSLSVSDESGLEKHYVFNAATGSIIDIQEFIHTTGISFIRKKLITALSPKNESDTLEAPHSEFVKCIKEDIHNYKLTQDSLIIFVNNCNISEQESTINSLAFESKTLSKYLSNYGQAMFGLNKKLKMKKMASTMTMGMYSGKEGPDDILIQLNQPFNKQISGIVYYPKDNKSYQLEGIFKNNKIETILNRKKYHFTISSGQIQGMIKEGKKIVQHLSLSKI